MKKLNSVCTLFLLWMSVFLFALTETTQAVRIGQKLPNVTIRDANNRPIRLPHYGTNPLLIFYPDPDHPKCKFTDYLETHQIPERRLRAYGVVNMKDAPLYPNGIIRAAIRKKIKKTGAKVYTDPNRTLAKAWGLGDCNNVFVIIIIDQDGRLLYLHKGEPNAAAIKQFYNVIHKVN